MGVIVQVRGVPEDAHRILKARAAASGVTLNAYLRSILEHSASRPTPDELSDRIKARGEVNLDQPIEVTVRRLRQGAD